MMGTSKSVLCMPTCYHNNHHHRCTVMVLEMMMTLKLKLLLFGLVHSNCDGLVLLLYLWVCGDAHNGVNTMVNLIVTGSGDLGHKGVDVYVGVRGFWPTSMAITFLSIILTLFSSSMFVHSANSKCSDDRPHSFVLWFIAANLIIRLMIQKNFTT